VGRRPRRNYILIRLDPRKAFEPGNVAWRPRSGAHAQKFTYGGKSRTLEQWAKVLKISRETLRMRMVKCRQRGWELDKAFSAAAWPRGRGKQLPSLRDR
jgi:hypothetical protein